jgi:N-acetylglucosaminyl-diphospho-decaprenol L-rhamnosyltransferase
LSVELSVVIVNWNTRNLLARCLESVEADLLGGACEVRVVDNASTDGSAALVRERFAWAELVENGVNVGFAKASNQGISRSQGRYVLLLNSDTQVLPGALPTLTAFMDLHSRAGAAGARLLNADGSLQASCHPMLMPGREFWRLLFLDYLWPRATYSMLRWDVRSPRLVEVIKGACLFLRREALAQVGVLDERYFVYTEEVDLCYRLAQAGWELWWVPQAAVVHHNGQSTRQVAAQMYVQLYRSKVQFYHKFGGVRRANRFKRLVRMAYWPRLVVAALGSPLSPALSSWAGVYRRLLAELRAM